MAKRLHAPFGYYGSKGYMIDVLLSLFPPHQAYVELFGGSAVVLLNKARSHVETLNDVDDHLIDFFRVLQDKNDFKRFVDLMTITPYSRKQHYEFIDTWREQSDRVEKVRQWFTMIRGSFNGIIDASWTYGRTRNKAKIMLDVVDMLPDIVHRLKCVQLDSRQWHEVIDGYDVNRDTFFYLDPPYLPSTRSTKKAYQHEMSYEDHVMLIDRLKVVQSNVMLSGYNNELYNTLGWERIDYEVKSRAPLQKYVDNERKTESIWINYSPSEVSPQRDLF